MRFRKHRAKSLCKVFTVRPNAFYRGGWGKIRGLPKEGRYQGKCKHQNGTEVCVIGAQQEIEKAKQNLPMGGAHGNNLGVLEDL